jgi:predicted glycoside hydrolase/deacetylase ChbG (UPF0249 family)
VTNKQSTPTTGQGGTRRVWLCADDFALNEAVSEGILALLSEGRLSMTSCMTQAPLWRKWGALLRDADYGSRAGLHFNLTEAFPGIPVPSLGSLMLRTSLRRVDRDAIRATLRHQLDDYTDVMQQAPAFVDGHQHVHAFPVVRDILLDVLETRFPVRRPWIRNVAPPTDPLATKPFKQTVIMAAGGKRFTAELAQREWPRNDAFAGIYGLTPDAPFGTLMQGWIASLAQSKAGLIMCHPAKSAEVGDIIGLARAAEFAWLSSDAWPEVLERFRTKLELSAQFSPNA